MSTEDPCKAFFPADPDIAGIGIRISIYINTILLAIASGSLHLITGQARASGPLTMPDGAGMIVTSAGLQGLVLLITAIIQTASHQLSLYHAFIIFHLLTFLGIHLAPPLFVRSCAQYNKNSHLARLVVSGIFSVASYLAYTGWMIYMLARAPEFGPQELRQCNNRVLYPFFFKSVHVTTKWLRILLGLSGVVPFLLILTFFGPILYAVYGVVTLEVMIRRNKFIIQEGETSWGFGQVLAMVLLVGPFKDLMFILSYILERRSVKHKYPGLLRSIVQLISLLKNVIFPTGVKAGGRDSIGLSEFQLQRPIPEGIRPTTRNTG